MMSFTQTNGTQTNGTHTNGNGTNGQTAEFKRVNRIKANFDSIYMAPDPREYYRVLYGLDYIIPDLAKEVFRNTIAALEVKLGRPVRVLDLGCSYGINAALIKYPLDIGQLAQRYMGLYDAGISSGELIELDAHYFQSWPRYKVEVIGCDVSGPAVNYARSVGLIDYGVIGNFETQSLPPASKDVLRGVDLIISTGSIGYITERTLQRMLDAIGGPAPWVASFVLRMFPYDKIDAILDKTGLVTEKLAGATFVQRRFESESECLDVLKRLEDLGIDPQNKEATGLLHAELYMSRSEQDRVEFPLETLASVTDGADRHFGRRFHCGSDGAVTLMR
jgi:SAM-dependent methyltransferase